MSHVPASSFERRPQMRNGGPALAQTLVAHLCEVSIEDLRSSTRGKSRVAFARQMAMYLTHVVYGLTLAQVASDFGRDRTTVSHACHRMEDLREDPLFDRQLAQLETFLRAAATLEVLQ